MVTMNTIWEKLGQHNVDMGPSAKGWCYDTLLGAAFALNKAQEIGTAEPEAYKIYRREIRNLSNSQSNEAKCFAWGFYLNSGMHRVVWGCERLLRYFTGLDDYKNTFKQVVKKALTKQEGRNSLTEVLNHFSTIGHINENDAYKSIHVTPENVLFILRGRVNRMKHWGIKASGHETRGYAENGKWNDLDSTVQFEFVTYALGLVIDLYWETVL